MSDERNYEVDAYLRRTPTELLEHTGTVLSWGDTDAIEYGEQAPTTEHVVSAALHGIAKILLADDFESMRLAADEARKELIREFIRWTADR